MDREMNLHTNGYNSEYTCQAWRGRQGGLKSPLRDAPTLPPSPEKTPSSKTEEICSLIEDCEACLPAAKHLIVEHDELCVRQGAELLMMFSSGIIIDKDAEEIAIESHGDTEDEEDAPYQYPETKLLRGGRLQYNSSNYRRLERYAGCVEAAYGYSTLSRDLSANLDHAFQAMQQRELKRKQGEEEELRVEHLAKERSKRRKKSPKALPMKGTPEHRLVTSCPSERAEDIEKFFAVAVPEYWATGIASFDLGLAEQTALRDAELAKHAHIDPRTIDCRMMVSHETFPLPSALKNLVITMEPKHQFADGAKRRRGPIHKATEGFLIKDECVSPR